MADLNFGNVTNPPISEDEHFFTLKKGQKVAKAGLSEDHRAKLSGMIRGEDAQKASDSTPMSLLDRAKIADLTRRDERVGEYSPLGLIGGQAANAGRAAWNSIAPPGVGVDAPAPPQTDQPAQPSATPAAPAPASIQPTGPAAAAQVQPQPMAMPVPLRGTGGPTTFRSPDFSGAAVQKLDESTQATIDAVDGQAAVAQKRAAAEADLAHQNVATQAGLNAASAKVVGDRDRANQEGADRVKNYLAELSKPLPKVDPEHYWAEKGAGMRIVAVIGGFFGGWGGGANPTLQAISSGIARDIDAQKANIAGEMQTREAKLGGAKTLYSMARESGADAFEAQKMAEIGAWKLVDTKFKDIAGGFASPELQAKAAEFKAGLQQKASELGAQLAQHQDESARATAALNAQTSYQQQNLGIERDKLDVERAKILLSQKAAKEPASNLRVPGIGIAISEKGAEALREEHGAHNTLQSAISELKGLREKYGVEWFKRSDAGSMMSALHDEIIMGGQKFHGFTRLSEVDKELQSAMAGGDPTRVGNVLGTLDQLARRTRQKFYDDAKAQLDPQFGMTLPADNPQDRPGATEVR